MSTNIKAKKNCIIVPVSTIVNTDLPIRAFAKRGRTPHYTGKEFSYVGVITGYIAIGVYGDKFFIGTSKCCPEDLEYFSTDFGKRVAYKRMRINQTNNVVCDIEKVCELINHEEFNAEVVVCSSIGEVWMDCKVSYYPEDCLIEDIRKALENNEFDGHKLSEELIEKIIDTFVEVQYDFE